MNAPNPFIPTMERMQMPPGMGRSLSVRGMTLEADADGVLEVPKDVARELEPHGLTKVVEKPAKK